MTSRHTQLVVAVLVVSVAGCTGRATSAPNGSGRADRTTTDDRSAEIEPGASKAASAPKPNETPQPPPRDDRLVDKTFDDIKFEMEKEDPFERSMLTPEIESLTGRRIRIRGYILPTVRSSGIRQFILVRDNMECCFGPGAALFDCIVVKMQEGQTANFSIRPVAVEGRFGIQELIGPDGRHLAIFELAGESVR